MSGLRTLLVRAAALLAAVGAVAAFFSPDVVAPLAGALLAAGAVAAGAFYLWPETGGWSRRRRLTAFFVGLIWGSVTIVVLPLAFPVAACVSPCAPTGSWSDLVRLVMISAPILILVASAIPNERRPT